MRRFGESPRADIKYTMRPGAYAILPRAGQILLTYQGAPHHEFQLPGGGIDAGEGPIAALHREVFEETGWRIGGLRRIGAYRRFGYMPDYDLWAEKLCHIYIAKPVRPHGPPSETGHQAVWMDAERAVDQLANAGDTAFLTRLLG